MSAASAKRPFLICQGLFFQELRSYLVTFIHAFIVAKMWDHYLVSQFISQVMSFLIGFVSMVFCGHLGKTELAGVALANAVNDLRAV